MLTEAQKDLHWSASRGWGRVCAVNRWSMVAGTLSASAVGPADSEWHAKVWAAALALATARAHAIEPNDLRQGAYVIALGESKSLTKFNNGDLDRVLVLFRLLIEPDDLRAVTDWRAYERFDQAAAERLRCRQQGIPFHVELPDDPGERRRHLNAVRDLPEAIVRKFARDRFAGTLPEDMTLAQLRDFTRTIKNRRAYNNRPGMEAVDCPF